MTQFGADDHYMEIQGGQLLRGPLLHGVGAAGRRAGRGARGEAGRQAVRPDRPDRAATCASSGKSLRVIGLYQNPQNIFQPPTQEIGAIIPFETARRSFRYDETNALWIVVKPRDGVSVTQAMDAVTLQLRRLRGLRAGDAEHASTSSRRTRSSTCSTGSPACSSS